jgi:hypothetical protein
VRCATCKSSGSNHQVVRACDQHPQHEVDDSSQATSATSPSRPANDGSVKPQVTKKPRVIMIEANSPWFDGGMEIAGGERNAVEHYA